MPDVVGNLHLHTIASDGTGTHDEVASAAAQAGLDFIIYTDHNIWVDGIEGWYHDLTTDRKILRLMGQEVNDEHLEPERNHLLCHFVCSDLNGVVADPQQLIDTATERGGLCFLAHPFERPGYGAAEQTYPWVSWDISGFTGIELWNAMSDTKWRLRTLLRGVIGAYLPNWVFSAPFPELLVKWDELLAMGQKVVAIGGSDAHGWSFSLGPLTRTVYPYEYLFGAINTHLILPESLDEEVNQARSQVHQALTLGHCYVSYDAIGSPRGFTFTGTSGTQQAMMGDTLTLQSEARLRVVSPRQAKLRLIKDGRLVAATGGKELTWQTAEPGVYRVEAYRQYWGQQRGWVFTNPIYLKSEA